VADIIANADSDDSDSSSSSSRGSSRKRKRQADESSDVGPRSAGSRRSDGSASRGRRGGASNAGRKKAPMVDLASTGSSSSESEDDVQPVRHKIRGCSMLLAVVLTFAITLRVHDDFTQCVRLHRKSWSWHNGTRLFESSCRIASML